MKQTNREIFTAAPRSAATGGSGILMSCFSKKVTLFCLLCLLGGCLSLAKGQDASWDLQNYHIYNAYALLHPCRWRDFLFAQSQSFLNPVLDVPLALLDAAFPRAPRLVAFCMGLPFGALAFFVVRVGRRLFAGMDYGLWAVAGGAAVGLTGSAAISQIGLSSDEVVVAAAVVAALDIMLAAPERLVMMALSGGLAGLAVGGKLTAGPYAVGLAGALVVAAPPRRLAARLAVFGAAGLAGVMATGGWWMAHLLASYGNPIFPYANQVFQSPWAGPYGYNDTRFFAHSWRQALFYPFWWIRRNDFYVTEKPFADARLAAVMAVLIAAAAVGLVRRRLVWPPPAWRAVIMFWLFSYVLWEKLFSIYRYTVPLEVMSGFLIFGAARFLAPRRAGLATAAAMLLAVFIGRATIYPNWGHMAFQNRSVPVGLPVMAAGTLVIAPGAEAVSFVAAGAPPGVTFVGVNNNFVVPDTSLTWQRLDDMIAGWKGPVGVIEPAAAGAAAAGYLAAVYDVAVGGSCQAIRSALDQDGLRFCPARVLQGPAPYQPEWLYDFSSVGNAAGILGAGWGPPQGWGRWNDAPDARLAIPLNPASHRPVDVGVLAYANVPENARGVVDVYANGTLVARWRLGADPAWYRAVMPSRGAKLLTLDFRAPAAFGIGILALHIQEDLNFGP